MTSMTLKPCMNRYRKSGINVEDLHVYVVQYVNMSIILGNNEGVIFDPRATPIRSDPWL